MTDSTINPEYFDGLGKKLVVRTIFLVIIFLAFAWLPLILSHLSVEINKGFSDNFVNYMISYALFIVLTWTGYAIADGQTGRFNRLFGLDNLTGRELIYRRTVIGMQIMGAGIILGSLAHTLVDPNVTFNWIMTVACCSILIVGIVTSHELNSPLIVRDPIRHMNLAVNTLIALPLLSYAVFMEYPSFGIYFLSEYFGTFYHYDNAVFVLCNILLISAYILSKVDTSPVLAFFIEQKLPDEPARKKVLKVFVPFFLILLCEIAMILGFYFTGNFGLVHDYIPITILWTLYIRSTVKRKGYQSNPHQITG